MSDLPKGWSNTKLGVICSKPQYGWTSKASREGRVKYVRTTDISGGKINWDEVPFCELEPEDIDKFRVHEDDILVSRAGSVGVSFRIRDVPYEAVFASYLIRFNALESALPKYIEFFLRSKDYWHSISEFSAGIAVPNVNASKLAQVEIPLPPLNEQRRIVAKLEKLLSRVNAAQERLATIRGILKRFRQSVLSAACYGRLTSNWRKENPGGVPIEAIIESLFGQRLSEANTPKKEADVKAIYGYSETEDPNELPEGWCFIALGKVCKSFDYGTSSKSQKSGAVPVLRMGNIQNGEIDWSDLVYTSDEDEIRKYALKQNTVLFNRTNSPELVGKTGIYRGERQAIFAGYLIRINNFDVLQSSYLNYCLNTDYAKGFCLRVKTDGVSQSNINAQKLAHFEVPLCRTSEQQEIIRRVESLFKTAEGIEARYHKAKAYADKLTQSILARAFSGELVPQDPTDEPAAELLERIRAMQASEPKTSKVKQPKKAVKMKRNGISIESIKHAIRQLPEPRFLFSDLRSVIGGDYDSLKAVVFEVLAEEPPLMKQIFDNKTKSMVFERADQ
jgi:type I restriction enzyme, S subunit